MKIDNEILISFLNGELGEEEQREVEQWYGSSEENQKMLEQLYYILFLSDRIKAEKSIDTEKSLREFKSKLKKREESRRHNLKKRNVNWKSFAVAAVFIGIIFIGALSLLNISEKVAKPFVATTNLGERTLLTLPDGTKVWLNACSRLEYRTSLFSTERKVNMSGEAYFEVEHDKNAPFVINSRDLRIEVLGTKFNIRANEDEPLITTTLLEGSVLVTASGETEGMVMKPFQQLSYDQGTGKTILTDCPTSNDYISWIDNKLYFENTRFEDIAKSLERHYNIHFVFAKEKLKDERFTAEFQTNDNIYQILSILKLTGKFNYKVDKRTVTLDTN